MHAIPKNTAVCATATWYTGVLTSAPKSACKVPHSTGDASCMLTIHISNTATTGVVDELPAYTRLYVVEYSASPITAKTASVA